MSFWFGDDDIAMAINAMYEYGGFSERVFDGSLFWKLSKFCNKQEKTRNINNISQRLWKDFESLHAINDYRGI